MHLIYQVYILAYVDDLLVIGSKQRVESIIKQLLEKFLMKHTGDLNSEGAKVNFLGRQLVRFGDSIRINMKSGYFDADLEWFGLSKSKGSNTPGTNTVKRPLDGVDLLNPDEHRIYRAVVGRLQWICPLRPDLNYPVKELARALSAPTIEDKFKMKHVLRYIKGTLDYSFVLRPYIKLSDAQSELDLVAEADSDWAGCSRTIKSTSGFLIELLGAPV